MLLWRLSGGIAYAPYEESHFTRDNRTGRASLLLFKFICPVDFLSLMEPEAALSPQRQLALLALIYDACKKYNSRFIIETHSPILLAAPNATIYSMRF